MIANLVHGGGVIDPTIEHGDSDFFALSNIFEGISVDHNDIR